MNRWLLNTFPGWLLFLAIVGAFVGLAAAGKRAVQRRFAAAPEEKKLAISGSVFEVAGGVFALLVAFVVVAAWSDFKSAEDTVTMEGSHLARLMRDSRAFPPSVQDSIRADVGRYLHEVVNREWNLMAEGKQSTRAWTEVDALFADIRAFEPKTTIEQASYQEAFQNLNDFVASRRERLFRGENQMPGAMEGVMFASGLLVVGFSLLLGPRDSRFDSIMVFGVAGLVAGTLWLTIMLSEPFAGDVRVSNHPLRSGELADLYTPR